MDPLQRTEAQPPEAHSQMATSDQNLEQRNPSVPSTEDRNGLWDPQEMQSRRASWRRCDLHGLGVQAGWGVLGAF